MQSFQLQVPATVTVTEGGTHCTVRLVPLSFKEGEPLVEYALVSASVSFRVPQKAVRTMPNSFLAKQLDIGMSDVSEGDGCVRVELRDPAFSDPSTFSLILDYLNRRLDGPSTLRRIDLQLSKAQWANLVELERFIFVVCDRNPFWTGLTGQHFRVHGNVAQEPMACRQIFSLDVNPHELVVHGPMSFSLRVLLGAITNPVTRPVSLLRNAMPWMEFPFPVDFKTSFFIPHKAIRCVIEGASTVCEGVLHADGQLRIEPVNARAFHWFHFKIIQRYWWPLDVVYGQ